MTAIHALLVGIDRYMPERFADGRPIPPLAGAVNDVIRVRRYLENGPLAVPPERIRQLVSPHPWSEVSAPDPFGLPTRENLIREIRAVGERAAPGDQALIHFSGHGARVPTAVPEVKGEGAWDECLVPLDVAAGGVLRDVEIHALISEIAAAGIRVCAVLDSCHSGGALRGGDSHGVTEMGVRSLGHLPADLFETGELVDSADELIQRWGLSSTPAHRRFHVESGWFPRPPGGGLVAACGPDEVAREHAFGRARISGVLTHFLVEALERLGVDAPLEELHDRLIALVASRFSNQTPIVEGDSGSRLLGRGPARRHRRPTSHLALVLEEPRGEASLTRLAMGWFHGVGTGARFAASGCERLAESDFVAEGRVEIVEAYAVESLARVDGAGTNRIAAGSILSLVDAGPLGPRCRIGLPPSGEDESMCRLDLELRGRLPIRAPVHLFVAGCEDAPDLHVEIDGEGRIVILDDGGVPLANQPPPISVHDPDAPECLIARLEHLARYRAVESLRRLQNISPVSGRLRVDLFRPSPGSLSEEAPSSRAVQGPVEVGERLRLIVRNDTETGLKIVVLGLHPDWSVVRLHPPVGRGRWEHVDAAGTTATTLVPYVPPGMDMGRELILVFGCSQPFDLTCHEMDSLAAVARRPPGPARDPEGSTPRSSRGPSSEVVWGVTSVELDVTDDGRLSPSRRLSVRSTHDGLAGKP